MTSQSVWECAASLRPRYLVASRAEKVRLLTEFCRLTGRHRKSAIRLLRRRPRPSPARGGRPRHYGPDLVALLRTVWEASDYLCGKRLAPFLPTLVEALERHQAIQVPPALRPVLLRISAPTIDRLLRPHRRGHPRGLATTGPSHPALAAQVPIRTSASGRMSALAASRPTSSGIAARAPRGSTSPRSWPSMSPPAGRTARPCGARAISASAPASTRSAAASPCRCANCTPTTAASFSTWALVRRLIGYDRYTSHAALTQLNAVYDVLRLYWNFFQPLRKLTAKVRHGARVTKRYDRAQTPYQRLLTSGVLPEAQRHALVTQYQQLNPVALRAELQERLQRLWRLADRLCAPTEEPGKRAVSR